MNEPTDINDLRRQRDLETHEYFSAEAFDVWWQDQGPGLEARLSLNEVTVQYLAHAAWHAAFRLATTIATGGKQDVPPP